MLLKLFMNQADSGLDNAQCCGKEAADSQTFNLPRVRQDSGGWAKEQVCTLSAAAPPLPLFLGLRDAICNLLPDYLSLSCFVVSLQFYEGQMHNRTVDSLEPMHVFDKYEPHGWAASTVLLSEGASSNYPDFLSESSSICLTLLDEQNNQDTAVWKIMLHSRHATKVQSHENLGDHGTGPPAPQQQRLKKHQSREHALPEE